MRLTAISPLNSHARSFVAGKNLEEAERVIQRMHNDALNMELVSMRRRTITPSAATYGAGATQNELALSRVVLCSGLPCRAAGLIARRRPPVNEGLMCETRLRCCRGWFSLKLLPRVRTAPAQAC